MHTVVGAHDLVIVLRSGQFRQRVVKPRLPILDETALPGGALDGKGGCAARLRGSRGSHAHGGGRCVPVAALASLRTPRRHLSTRRQAKQPAMATSGLVRGFRAPRRRHRPPSNAGLSIVNGLDACRPTAADADTFSVATTAARPNRSPISRRRKPRLFGWSEAAAGSWALEVPRRLMVYDRCADEPAEMRGVRRPVLR